MSKNRMTHDEALALAPAFVLGALEEADIAEVREHLATCQESHVEFERLGGVVPYLLESPEIALVEPPASLRDRVMAAAAADLAERGGAPAAPIAFPSPAKRESRSRETPRWTRSALGIAAVIAIFALAGWNLLLQSDLNAARRFDEAVAVVLDTAAEPGSKTVVLIPSANSSANGIAAVRPDGSVVLALRNLPAISGSEVYEAWVIAPGGAPVAVGSFKVDPRGNAQDVNGLSPIITKQADAPPGSVIAVTREPKAGNTSPQGPIVSAGVATAPPG